LSFFVATFPGPGLDPGLAVNLGPNVWDQIGENKTIGDHYRTGPEKTLLATIPKNK